MFQHLQGETLALLSWNWSGSTIYTLIVEILLLISFKLKIVKGKVPLSWFNSWLLMFELFWRCPRCRREHSPGESAAQEAGADTLLTSDKPSPGSRSPPLTRMCQTVSSDDHDLNNLMFVQCVTRVPVCLQSCWRSSLVFSSLALSHSLSSSSSRLSRSMREQSSSDLAD